MTAGSWGAVTVRGETLNTLATGRGGGAFFNAEPYCEPPADDGGV